MASEKRVTRCRCFLQDRSHKLFALANIPERYKECNFLNYQTGTDSTLAKAKIELENWALQYRSDKPGLLVIGPRGVGKTHLSIAALKELMRNDVRCLFCDYLDLLRQIRNSYNSSVEATELEVLRPVFEAEVLLLDDLGAERPSGWVWDTVSFLLNTRYNDKRTTIVTTNFEDGPARNTEISAVQAAGRKETLGDRIGERMRSRLFEMCKLVQIDGKDYRPNFRSDRAR